MPKASSKAGYRLPQTQQHDLCARVRKFSLSVYFFAAGRNAMRTTPEKQKQDTFERYLLAANQAWERRHEPPSCSQKQAIFAQVLESLEEVCRFAASQERLITVPSEDLSIFQAYHNVAQRWQENEIKQINNTDLDEEDQQTLDDAIQAFWTTRNEIVRRKENEDAETATVSSCEDFADRRAARRSGAADEDDQEEKEAKEEAEEAKEAAKVASTQPDTFEMRVPAVPPPGHGEDEYGSVADLTARQVHPCASFAIMIKTDRFQRDVHGRHRIESYECISQSDCVRRKGRACVVERRFETAQQPRVDRATKVPRPYGRGTRQLHDRGLPPIESEK